jgi:predicted regulator of Ras-like GTPase activity (Roadblock/LC7/MglB family)
MAENLETALRELQQSSGLAMAAVVGADGLVIDASAEPGIDAESICSVAANGLLMMDALSHELQATSTKMMTLEYENDTILLAPMDQDTLLVLLAGAGTNLGRLRILMRRSTETLSAALAAI